MKKKTLSTLVVCGFILGLAGTAGATESRSQSLLYNLAFEDQTDMFMFPQLLPEYQGMYFHMPAAISNVFGGVVLGLDGAALGVFVHRPLISAFDQYRILVTDGVGGGVGLLGGGGAVAAEPHVAGQIFDVMYGTGSWGVSFRTHVWSDVSGQQGVLADPPVGNSAITADVNAGFKMGPGFQMRANLGFSEIKDFGFTLRAAAGTRYIAPGSSPMRLVMAGEFQLGILSPSTGDMSFGMAIPVKAGWNYSVLPEVLTVALLGGVDIQLLSPGGGDMKLGMAVPTVEIAAEWKALKWLELRTAIKGGYGVQFAGEANEDTPKYEQMAFSSGVGVMKGPFRFDTVLQYGLWQNGPWFIGGTPGLFAGVSLAYVWGDNVSYASPAPVAEAPLVAPTPKPAPAVKPAPAPESPAPAKDKPEFDGWEGNE